MPRFSKPPRSPFALISYAVLLVLTVGTQNASASSLGYLPFLELDENATFLPRVDDGASDSIDIPLGFPLNDGSVQDRVYVSTNGLLSFGNPYTNYLPTPLSQIPSAGNYFVAPFWSDINIGIAGQISYMSYSIAGGPIAITQLEQVSSFIREASNGSTKFSGDWMAVAFWDGVAQYDGSKAVTNTFQAVLISNSTESYTIFTYRCGFMQWSGNPTIIGIKVAAFSTLFSSSGPSARNIACLNGNWTNVVYRLDDEDSGIGGNCDVVGPPGSVTKEVLELYGNCVPYYAPPQGGPCDSFFTDGVEYVYIPYTRTNGDLTSLHGYLAPFRVALGLVQEPCFSPAIRFICQYFYPPCGNSTHFTPPSSVCPEDCAMIATQICKSELESLLTIVDIYNYDSVGLSFPNCSDPGDLLYPLPHCCISVIETLPYQPKLNQSFPESTPQAETQTNKGVLTVAAAVGSPSILLLVLVICTIVAAYLWRRRKSRREMLFTKEDEPLSQDSASQPKSTIFYATKPATGDQLSADYLQLVKENGLLIPENCIELLTVVGQGEFGIVYRATLSGWKEEEDRRDVAVKTLRGAYPTFSDFENVMQESLKMRDFDHPNVLSLIGISINPPYIVLPYMANGSLLHYLRKERPNLTIANEADNKLVRETEEILLSMVLQVARGMEYLAQEKLVHRDLAARNCMIDENHVIKVADFGLMEDVYSRNYFRGKRDRETKLPFKWMALESLADDVFTEKTDVWSFGVTCWEVFILGKTPYPGMDPFTLTEYLERGERLAKPTNAACSGAVYEIVLTCWKRDPTERPTFTDLVASVSKLLKGIGELHFGSSKANLFLS